MPTKASSLAERLTHIENILVKFSRFPLVMHTMSDTTMRTEQSSTQEERD